jgi:hypothetical protein
VSAEPEERPYKDGFGTWQVMVPHAVPAPERAAQAAAMIAEAMRAEGRTPPEGGVQVRSLGTWTTFEHFTEESGQPVRTATRRRH